VKSTQLRAFLLSISLFLISSSPPAQAQSTITIGDTNLESGVDNGNGNLVLAQEAALSQSATIVSLSFYVTQASGSLILGVYDATGPAGHPGRLWAVTNSFATVKGWNTASVVTPVSLAAGSYWLAYLPSSGNLGFLKQNDSGSCVDQGQTFSNGMPATFATSTTSCSPTTWSFYATLVPSGGTVVNGVCGSSNGATLSSAPTANLCSAGTASSMTGTGPWNWACAGSGGGTTASCSAQLQSGSGVAPSITTQPQNQTVTVGAMAKFSVVATGTTPLSYQWYKNMVAISGATSASYTTPATVTGDNGSAFTVQVSNGAGSITSNAAILTVTTTAVAPTITTQPLDQSVTVGGTATFIVVASGTAPLTYQWSENGSVITGATSASYTTPAVSIGDSGSTFSVKVSNSAGSATSNAASLTVTATSGAPVMFQHIASSTNPVGNGISGHNFTFHTESLPPNTVAVMGVSAPSGKTVSISDSLAGSWSSAICTAGAAADETAWVFVQSLGATGGPDAININVGSSDTQPVQYVITFWQNISTSAPANGSLCAGSLMPGAGGVINPGAFTPATNNDVNGGNLIWSYTPLCTGYAASNPSKWVPGAGFSLLNGEIGWASNQGFPDASQYLLQTASAAVTPSITATGDTADCFNSASVALKVANNSAAVPSTIHVASILHETPFGYSGATMTVQTPTVGNLRVIGFPWEGGSPGGAGPAVQSVSSSDNCSWTVIGETNGAAVQAYAQNCTPCPNCTTSVTMSGSGANQGSFRFYDIQNAQSSSYQNSTGNSGSCGAPVAANMPGNFTPTGANSGLTIATNGNGQGPLTGLAAGSPAGTFDLWTYTDQTDSDLADNADGQAHFYYSSKATQTWNWTKVTAGDVCYWWASNYN
jgi:hypothetical protein